MCAYYKLHIVDNIAFVFEEIENVSNGESSFGITMGASISRLLPYAVSFR